MKEKVMDILMDLRPDVDFENEKKLIGDGILESFDIMSLVAELEDEFDVKIKPKDLVAENFNSVDDMVAMLQKLGAQYGASRIFEKLRQYIHTSLLF